MKITKDGLFPISSTGWAKDGYQELIKRTYRKDGMWYRSLFLWSQVIFGEPYRDEYGCQSRDREEIYKIHLVVTDKYELWIETHGNFAYEWIGDIWDYIIKLHWTKIRTKSRLLQILAEKFGDSFIVKL